MALMEKRLRLQQAEVDRLTSSLISFEKVLTTLITASSNPFGGGSSGGGWPGPDDIH